MKIKYYLLFFTFLFYSCSSISLREGLNINEKEDWLQIGRDENKTNISDTGFILKPPFTEIWNFNTDAAFANNVLSASDGVLFAACLNGDIFAIDIKSGSGIGKINTKSKSSNSTPLIMKNIIALTFGSGSKNFIAGYDFVTGEYEWKKSTGETISSPISKGNEIFYATTKGNIYKIDCERGKQVWVYRNNFSFFTSPTVSNDYLFTGDVKGNLISLDVNSGKPKWNFKTGDGIYSDVSVYKDRIFFGSDDKNYYCLDTAGKLIWKKYLDTKFFSSPTFYPDNVICTGINGKIYSLDINTGDIVWEYETKGTITASPVLNGDKIYVGSYDRFFYCLDANKGEVLWKYEFDERIRTSAVIWQKYLIIACDDKSIYCFK